MPTSGLETKDIATISLSFAALLTSASVAIYNWRVQVSRQKEEARKVFDESIAGLQTARSDMEALKIELGDKYRTALSRPRRIMINDRRNFYLARALASLRHFDSETMSMDNLLIAVALMESGKIAAAVRYYQRSVDLAQDEVERAICLRVFGRARILSGELERGRKQMIVAIEEFLVLTSDARFERSQMRQEAIDTARRLVEASNSVRYDDHLAADLNAYAELAKSAGTQAVSDSKEVIGRVRKQLDQRAEAALTQSAPPPHAPATG